MHVNANGNSKAFRFYCDFWLYCQLMSAILLRVSSNSKPIYSNIIYFTFNNTMCNAVCKQNENDTNLFLLLIKIEFTDFKPWCVLRFHVVLILLFFFSHRKINLIISNDWFIRFGCNLLFPKREFMTSFTANK